MGEVREEQPENRMRASASVMAINGVKVPGLDLKVFFPGRIASRLAQLAPLPRLDQRVKQHQLAVSTRGKVVGCSLWNMTNGSRTKVDASPFDSQTPAAFEHL